MLSFDNERTAEVIETDTTLTLFVPLYSVKLLKRWIPVCKYPRVVHGELQYKAIVGKPLLIERVSQRKQHVLRLRRLEVCLPNTQRSALFEQL